MTSYFALPRDFPFYNLAGLLLVPLRVSGTVFFVFFFFFFLIYLCIYFWLCWVFVAVCGLSLVVLSRGYSHCGAWSSAVVSFVAERSLGHVGFSSCGAWP